MSELSNSILVLHFHDLADPYESSLIVQGSAPPLCTLPDPTPLCSSPRLSSSGLATETKQAISPQPISVGGTSTGLKSATWTIDNKYYSVGVNLHSYSHHDQHLWKQIADQATAIIYVFHVDKVRSPLSCRPLVFFNGWMWTLEAHLLNPPWFPQVETFEALLAVGSVGEPDMRLCIGTSVHGEKVGLPEDFQARVEDFCIENAMEFIDFHQDPVEQGIPSSITPPPFLPRLPLASSTPRGLLFLFFLFFFFFSSFF